nr:hypothetical protein CFP56_60660 [Quercus suber]
MRPEVSPDSITTPSQGLCGNDFTCHCEKDRTASLDLACRSPPLICFFKLLQFHVVHNVDIYDAFIAPDLTRSAVLLWVLAVSKLRFREPAGLCAIADCCPFRDTAPKSASFAISSVGLKCFASE